MPKLNNPHFSGFDVGASGFVGGCMTGTAKGALTGAFTGAIIGEVAGGVSGFVGGDTTGALTGALTGDFAGTATGDGTTLPHGCVDGDFVVGNVVQLRFNLPGVAVMGPTHTTLLAHFCSEKPALVHKLDSLTSMSTECIPLAGPFSALNLPS